MGLMNVIFNDYYWLFDSQIVPNLIGKLIFNSTRIKPIIEPTIGYQVDFSKKHPIEPIVGSIHL